MADHLIAFDSNERLFERWRQHAHRRADCEAIVHWLAGEEPVRWKWGELIRHAEMIARWLQAQGVQPGQVCALIIRHHPNFYPVYLGTSICGALPAVLAYPN